MWKQKIKQDRMWEDVVAGYINVKFSRQWGDRHVGFRVGVW